jgi:hypothetical protein
MALKVTGQVWINAQAVFLADQDRLYHLAGRPIISIL